MKIAHRLVIVLGAVCAIAYLVAGGFGVSRYIETYWLYRGFPPPAHLKSILVGSGRNRHRIQVYSGTVSTITVHSEALGGRTMKVVVYLPPGYNQDTSTRYPVLYLLHGLPGSPEQFVDVGDIAVKSDVLLAEHRIRPMIFVMPSGSTSFFGDNEWANLIAPHNDWDTYVAVDVVQTIQHRYRTINRGSDRGIAGLSEGGYGAMNIALHHVGEFDLIEGWSAYYEAEISPHLFGKNKALLKDNSPADEVVHLANRLRAHHAYFWIYAGNRDNTLGGNVRFAAELRGLHVANAFSVLPGHHNWKLWRSQMAQSLIVASGYFSDGHAPA